MSEASIKAAFPCPIVGERAPDIRISCKSNPKDYLDLFLGETEVVFKTHYSFLDQKALLVSHVISLDSIAIGKIVRFVTGRKEGQLAFCSDTHRLELGFITSGGKSLAFELAKSNEWYLPQEPVIILNNDSIQDLLKPLNLWLREVDKAETPAFGLS